MHEGPYVYFKRGSRVYHYTDDDCPIVAKWARTGEHVIRITEEEAKQRGMRICGHCLKEYREDKAERVGCGSAAAVLLVLVAIGVAFL